jgi:hypothetical protein
MYARTNTISMSASITTSRHADFCPGTFWSLNRIMASRRRRRDVTEINPHTGMMKGAIGGLAGKPVDQGDQPERHPTEGSATPADLRRLVQDTTHPDSLAPERDSCACGAPLTPCPTCHGEGGWFDEEGSSVSCPSCRVTEVCCPNPECANSAQQRDTTRA